jgi:putative hemolysin
MYDHCMQNGGVEIQGWQTPGGGQYAVCVFEDGTIGKAFQFYLDGTKVPPDEGDSRID